MTSALLAIDQGTTSSRAILFSLDGDILFTQQKELRLYYPQKGWVEQDPDDIWNDTLWCCRDAVRFAQENGIEIAGAGITNQRETTIIWDRKTGRPVYNAIVWQDRRTADLCAKLKKHEASVSKKTGLLMDPYFSATKILWVLDNIEGVRARAEKGELAFGTVDSWLLWNLTGGKVHATDITNVSRTMLFNIVKQEWDKDLLKLFNIPASLLPAVHDNVHAFGDVNENIFGQRLIIGGMAGDQQAALIGQACFKPGMVKSTYGTGCFALVNIGRKFRTSKNRLLTTVAYRLNGEIAYAIEGSIFVAGAAVQWLRDGLKILCKSSESEGIAHSVADNNGVYFVPAFTGLGAPYWRPDAKAVITGLSRESHVGHIVRAALEAQGFQTLDLMSAMEKDSNAKVEVLRADGGLIANGFVCQFLADILNRPVEIPRVTETTAWGAACLAGLQSGVFKNFDDISARWRAHRRYDPLMEISKRENLYAGWQEAVSMLL